MKTTRFNQIAFVFTLLLVIIPMFLFAQDTGGETSATPIQIVEWLTPFIVLGTTWVAKKVLPAIPGWATMLVVTALSTALAWITNLVADSGDEHFFVQVGYGLLAIVINQFYRQITASRKPK